MRLVMLVDLLISPFLELLTSISAERHAPKSSPLQFSHPPERHLQRLPSSDWSVNERVLF